MRIRSILAPYRLLMAASILVISGNAIASPKDLCQDVLKGVEQRYNGYDSWRIMHFAITDQHGTTKERKLLATHSYLGPTRRTHTRVLEPKEISGIESLAFDGMGDQSDRIWTYLASIGKSHEIKSEDMSGRLLGSDLSVGEMMVRRAKDYDCQMLGESDYLGQKVWKLHVSPRTEAEVIRLGLRDGEVWVEQRTFQPVWSTFNADAPNEQRVMETDRLHWLDGVYSPGLFRVQTRKEGRVVSTTEISIDAEGFNVGLPNRWFSPEALGTLSSEWASWLLSAARL